MSDILCVSPYGHWLRKIFTRPLPTGSRHLSRSRLDKPSPRRASRIDWIPQHLNKARKLYDSLASVIPRGILLNRSNNSLADIRFPFGPFLTTEVDRSCYCFEARDRADRLVIVLFGNRGTALTPAQSVAIVCSTTRVWSGKSGTTPWMTMSVARPKIVNHQV